LTVANDVERTYGVALIPALLILTVMFVFHLQANRREMRVEAATAAREAETARARTRELEQLMAFGQTLSRALTNDALHEAIWRHLPPLAGGSDLWMLVRRDGDWDRVTDRAHARWRPGQIEAVADAVLRSTPEQLESPDGLEQDGYICYVIAPGQRTTGVIGLASPSAPLAVRRTVGAAATLLGIALRNVQLFSEVREHGLKDSLTGCFNRAHGLETLDAEIARARRGDQTLSVLMFDVDAFKRINDEHGHLAGDEVLAAVGSRLRQVLRRSDIRCRYGGDEFMVVLPETSCSGAMRVAEWVRGEMEQIEIADEQGGVRPTVSVGVASSQPGDRVDNLLERADRALYAAKAAGRNCVRASTPVARLSPVATLLRAAPAQAIS
jgi:diguanylate cyclase (GGDEF)-like protein